MKYVKMGTPKCKFLPYTLLKSRKNKLKGSLHKPCNESITSLFNARAKQIIKKLA